MSIASSLRIITNTTTNQFIHKQAEKEFRPAVSEMVDALTELIQKQNNEASTVADKTEVDPFSKFCLGTCLTKIQISEVMVFTLFPWQIF